MSTTHCTQLANRFEALAAEGLVDVKFFVRNLDEATTERVCSEVNALYAALDAGQHELLDFKDSRRA
ncbi:hypothetical protein EMQ25_00755 [Arsenicitalea aurantiaca]|uniref:Uncharacterized protein n=1 Tax=Arsenicitalea aurantiaca TaxID=1783274 RepID=A0A433XKB6_9HYPH|nr:hypothetical protein [Arsenicitalea aurantiaca]RUT34526.1 hypothetical protein EMQ25_00755 [Arsenicitalea aurantiaca]